MAIKETAQIAITMRVMDETRGLNVVDNISTEINSKIIKITNLNRIMAVKSQLLVEMTRNTGHSNYNSNSSFSDVSSFPNDCTVK